MAMTSEEQAAFDANKTAAEAATAKAVELEERFTELEGKAKAYDEVKSDMLKYKEEKIATEKAKIEESKKSMLEKEQYKTLYEQTETARLTAEKKAEESVSTVQRYIKTSALEAAAAKAGVKPEAMVALKRLTDFDKLEVKRTGEDIQITGLDALIAESQKLHPYLFGNGKPPRFDDPKGGSGNNDFKELAVSEIVKLEKSDKPAYLAYMKELQARQTKANKK